MESSLTSCQGVCLLKPMGPSSVFFHVEIFRASNIWNFHEGNLIKLTLQLRYHIMTISETTVVATLWVNDSDLKWYIDYVYIYTNPSAILDWVSVIDELSICHWEVFRKSTLPETNIAPETLGLEDEFPSGKPWKIGAIFLVSGRVTHLKSHYSFTFIVYLCIQIHPVVVSTTFATIWGRFRFGRIFFQSAVLSLNQEVCYCWWFRHPAKQLRLVVYPTKFQGFMTIQTVVGLGISSINSIFLQTMIWGCPLSAGKRRRHRLIISHGDAGFSTRHSTVTMGKR